MNITKENFQRILDSCKERTQAVQRASADLHALKFNTVQITNVKLGDVDGRFVFKELFVEIGPEASGPNPRLKIKRAGYHFEFITYNGDYQIHCCPDSPNFGFDFKAYDDFIENFKRLEAQVQRCVCAFHTLHRDHEICQALFDVEEKHKCGICLQERPINHFQKTDCGHLFCLPCLNQWAKHEHIQELKNERLDEPIDVFRCPMCRSNLEWCTECYSATFECTC
jgi:hypothetical protein